MAAAGCEIVGHGWRWLDYRGIDEATEREHITRSVEAIRRLTGSRPLGWYVGTPSANTRRLVVEEGGFLYDSDAYNDELPYWNHEHRRPQRGFVRPIISVALVAALAEDHSRRRRQRCGRWLQDRAVREGHLPGTRRLTAPKWMAISPSPTTESVSAPRRDGEGCAKDAGVIKGILLHQGESNTNDQQWPAKVTAIYENAERPRFESLGGPVARR